MVYRGWCPVGAYPNHSSLARRRLASGHPDPPCQRRLNLWYLAAAGWHQNPMQVAWMVLVLVLVPGLVQHQLVTKMCPWNGTVPCALLASWMGSTCSACPAPMCSTRYVACATACVVGLRLPHALVCCTQRCLQPWFTRHTTCPYCRCDVVEAVESGHTGAPGETPALQSAPAPRNPTAAVTAAVTAAAADSSTAATAEGDGDNTTRATNTAGDMHLLIETIDLTGGQGGGDDGDK